MPRLTIRLEGPTPITEDEASSRLEAVGDAFLFQFDLVHEGLPRLRELTADGRHHWMNAPRYDRRRARLITYPDHALRTEPLRLYHYGRTLSDEFPLLQFLSYYQVLEFFFPAYSRLDVVRRLQEAIRDPTFEVESTRQVDRLLDLIPNRATRGLGSEREQLRATIKHCIDLEELRQFLHTHRNKGTGLTLADYLADTGRLLGATPVPPDAPDGPLLQNLVERIYTLRSRIVHAKDAATSRALEEPISPFSPEARELHPEVEILRFLAEAVLESSAVPQ